ncbi:hypothetical protein MLD38_006675 [Melastoma candidum]|uniref:Uncharacterized protein n=1 Tax=Melastoma candidum TaxID=119954 RepID=A0ACB9RN74_9MYRT|nr:hypothetical protein MLD38_006675 [Melastoma candidum]
MAGLFPAIEGPRRRRQVHRGGLGLFPDPPSMDVREWSQLPPLYDLYATRHAADLSSTAAQRRHAGGRYSRDDVKLGGIAREAKARLDAKLRSQRKSDHRRESSMQVAMRTVQTEVFGMGKDSGSISRGGELGEGSSRMMGKLSGRTSWKSTDQDECAVCLEGFRVGENLMNLRCAHRFHTRCLVPWLESNTRCPCCRTDVISSSSSPPE